MPLKYFKHIKWNYRVKFLEQIAYNTQAKIEEHMLIIMDKSTHEEHLYEP